MPAIWGGVIAGVGALAGGALGSSAAKKAASGQADAARYATDVQKELFDRQWTASQPYRDIGTAALGTQRDLAAQYMTPIDASSVLDEPGYQFGLRQGLSALENSAAARGGFYSGNALKSATRYGTDYATTKYNDAWNRLNTERTQNFNRMGVLSGTGQNALAQMGQAGQAYADSVGNIAMGNANAQGAARLAQANLWGNALNSVGQLGYNYFRGRQQQPSASPAAYPGAQTPSQRAALRDYDPAYDPWAGY